MSHKMPFKKLIWKFSREANSRKYSRNFSWVSLTRELLAKQSQNSLSKAEKTLKLDHLTPSWTYIWKGLWKHPKNMFFIQKQLKKLWKTWVIQITSKSKQKEQKSFWFDQHMVKHTHITFEHVQSHKWNRYSLNIRLVCCMCVSNVE